MNFLQGKRILVVEDEAILAMTLEDILQDLDCTVVGPALRLDAGIELAKEAAIDAAILDVNVGNARSYAVADALAARGIPYLFATGYGASTLDPERTEVPVIAKPYRQSDLELALVGLLRAVGD